MSRGDVQIEAGPSGRKRQRRRGSLTRAEIVAVALRLIDREGIEALSMRRLGDELGVRAMAMYRHVRDKDELLDLVIDGVLADVDTIEPTGDWRSDAIRIAGSVRQAMQRHRHAVALLASRPWVGRAGLRGIDLTIGVFRGAGLRDRDAIHAQFALGNYVSGFSAWEAANLGAAGEDPDARRAALARYRASIAELPTGEYPALAAVGDELIGGTLDDRFAAGLAFLLDGIAARIADGSADRADVVDMAALADLGGAPGAADGPAGRAPADAPR